ncbi:MAG: Extracellular serine protease [Chlamydiae bacterium]|nr:Extracellular serine protease [Chlamydiota bacterium]
MKKIVLFLVFSSALFADNFPVTNTNNSGTGSLRDGISFLNGETGPNTIDFTPSLSSSIKLTTSLPVISEELTINGSVNSGRITVDGKEAVRIFASLSGVPGLRLENLDFIGGIGFSGSLNGGVVDADPAPLSLENGSFSNCEAEGKGGAIHSVSIITITGGTNTFEHCGVTKATSVGGAISSSGIIISGGTNTFDDCLSAGNGGAIYTNGLIDIKGGTTHFTNCIALKKGGAIYLSAGAGLIISAPVTFSNNIAPRGKDIFMEASAELIFEASDHLNLLNPIEGEGATPGGGLTVDGTGKLSLNGANTYTGTTTVTEGELHVDGSVITDVEVQNNGTLSGNLEIRNGKNLTNDGTIVPGDNGIGTITVGGKFTQNGTGKFKVDVTPTGDDTDKTYIVTTDAADVNGTLIVNIGTGNYIQGTEYLVVQGPINSHSLTIQETGAMKDQVFFDFVEGSLKLVVKNTVIFVCSELPNGNPRMMIQAFDHLNTNPHTPVAQIIEAFGTLNCPEPLADVLNKMSAANYANLEWMTLTTDTQLSYILEHHAHAIKCDRQGACAKYKDKGVWVSGLGNFENIKSFDWLSGYDANTAGLLVGMDFCATPFYFGFGGGYTYTDFHLKKDSGFGDIHSGFGTIYGGYLSRYFITNASLIIGGKHFDMHRKIAFLMVDQTPCAGFDAPFINTHLGLLGQMYFSDFRLEFFGNIDYHYLFLTSNEEKGSDINLLIQHHHSHFLKTELGTNFKGIFKRKKVCLAPFVGLSGVIKTPLGNTNYGAFFVGDSFYQDTLTSNDSQFLLSPRCGVRIYRSSFIFMMSYKGEFNKYTRDHQIDGGLEWAF